MLKIKNLHAEIDGYKVLRGIDLNVAAGEMHIIMGPNGSGKSSLASILAGHPGYDVTKGEISFLEENLIDIEPEDRARLGLFLAFQYPVEIPGVRNSNFLKIALNAQREARGLQPLNSSEFIKFLNKVITETKIDKNLVNRNLNEGFSGGEKKRNEILQMAILQPKLSILDEIDSGLDVDALSQVGTTVQNLRKEDNSFVLITHYPRILKYVNADFVHIMQKGVIVKSGPAELANQIEKDGYENLL